MEPDPASAAELEPDPASAAESWIAQALALARATAGLASPNPQVGCLLVKDGVVVGQGAHLYDARDHAEIVALRQAGTSASGSTAYVTLEPCSHVGRTGPCADALIAAGIRRCVVATADPNPQVSGQVSGQGSGQVSGQVSGQGIARLRAAGIAVDVGVCEAEARLLNEAFAWSIRHQSPFVTLKAALSSDGYLAPPPSVRATAEPHWLTGPESRAEVQRMRHAVDALVTGIGTVLADNPALTDRTGLPRRRPLLRVVLDTDLRIPLDSQLVRSANADLLVVCRSGASGQARLQALGVEVLAMEDQIAIPSVLEELARRRIISVLVEAGEQVNGAFLAGDHVQKLALFYSRTELGDGAIPFARGAGSPFLLQQRLHNLRRRQLGPDALVTGYLHHPWPNL